MWADYNWRCSVGTVKRNFRTLGEPALKATVRPRRWLWFSFRPARWADQKSEISWSVRSRGLTDVSVEPPLGRAIGNVLPADDGEALGRGLIDGRVDAAEPASDTAGRLLRL